MKSVILGLAKRQRNREFVCGTFWQIGARFRGQSKQASTRDHADTLFFFECTSVRKRVYKSPCHSKNLPRIVSRCIAGQSPPPADRARTRDAMRVCTCGADAVPAGRWSGRHEYAPRPSRVETVQVESSVVLR